MEELLVTETGNHDYDWLLTPPDTPPGTPRAPKQEVAEKAPPSSVSKRTISRSSSTTRASRSAQVGSKPDMAASNVLAATSSNKQKLNLTCTVCGITTTSETTMQEHLKGRSHGKKAAKLAPPLTKAGHHEVKETQSKRSPPTLTRVCRLHRQSCSFRRPSFPRKEKHLLVGHGLL